MRLLDWFREWYWRHRGAPMTTVEHKRRVW